QAQAEIRNLNTYLEQKVAYRTAQLENLIKEQEAFNYTVSHDLRAPLRHINGFSAILKEELGQGAAPEFVKYLDRIGTASEKMGQLIQDLLDFSQITRKELQATEINISAIAAEIMQMLAETNPERRVETVIAPDLMVRGDEALLRIALQNLLDNAWKYTGETAAPKIELGRRTIDAEEVFFVRDNGAGFDMAYRDKLFVVFQRLHGTNYSGTGIGLATVEKIIQKHNGRIWAEGQVNAGATFYFTLPATKIVQPYQPA
ncbi:MAG: PAS domain-containing sensor histidine kinase, partial [Geobacter sp.]|nr:PAS domain-containing sensor histidine kinase [Geobacter sp.]